MGNSTSTYMITNCDLPHSNIIHKILYITCNKCKYKNIKKKYICNLEIGWCTKYKYKIKKCNKCNFTL